MDQIQDNSTKRAGRPRKTDEQLKTYSFSLSESQVARLDGWASAKGESRSAIMRSLVSRLEPAPAVVHHQMKVAEPEAVVTSTELENVAEVEPMESAVVGQDNSELTVAQKIAAALASIADSDDR